MKYKKSNAESALSEVVRRLNAEPNNLNLWEAKASAYEKLGQPESAIETYLALAEFSRDNAVKATAGELAVQLSLKYSLNKYGYFSAKVFLKYAPNSAKALFFLGVFGYRSKHSYEAMHSLNKAIDLEPNNPACYLFKARSCISIGDPDTALVSSLKCNDLDASINDSYLESIFASLYSAEVSEEDVLHRHIEYFDRALGARSVNTRFENKKVAKVGFISGDLCVHSVVFFCQSLFEGLRDNGLEVYCYSVTSESQQDDMTEYLKSKVDAWRDMETMNDTQISHQIIKDSIDVLVDLTGYMGVPRPEVFQARSAPIQLSYIGYPHTTGLSEMDYRIVDRFTDPEGLTEKYTTETLLRLPHCFLCYTPIVDAPVPAMRDELEASSVVRFGSFNNFSKINSRVFDTWVEILGKVENSTLLIKAGPLKEDEFKEFVFERFERKGISRSRLELIGWTDGQHEHLELYGRVDIHLDTFPYNGTTTTCEAAWQGVPTVTFKGDSHRARVGYSLMHNMGLDDFVGDTIEDYIDIAVAKANDLDALAALRKTMRDRMRASPLMDRARYGRDVAELISGLKPRALI